MASTHFQHGLEVLHKQCTDENLAAMSPFAGHVRSEAGPMSPYGLVRLLRQGARGYAGCYCGG